MPAWLAPQSMKMGTTRNELDSPPREGCRWWVVPDGQDPPLKAEAFFPLPRRGFSHEPTLEPASRTPYATQFLWVLRQPSDSMSEHLLTKI